MLAGLTVATIAGAAWFSMSGADENSDDTSSPQSAELEPAPPNELDLAPQDVSNPIVVPIDDATQVVAQVDDNSAEADALDLLGLDETGNVVAAGHRFTWSSGSGDTTTITVDATTGNYALLTADGLEWRHVNGRSFSSSDGSRWTEVVHPETPASTHWIGVDAPVRVDQVLDPVTAAYATTTTGEIDGGKELVSAEVDAFAYSQGHPNEHLSWLARLGHPAVATGIQPGDIVAIEVELRTDDNTVGLMTVTTSSSTTRYSLDEILDAAPLIAAPL